MQHAVPQQRTRPPHRLQPAPRSPRSPHLPYPAPRSPARAPPPPFAESSQTCSQLPPRVLVILRAAQGLSILAVLGLPSRQRSHPIRDLARPVTNRTFLRALERSRDGMPSTGTLSRRQSLGTPFHRQNQVPDKHLGRAGKRGTASKLSKPAGSTPGSKRCWKCSYDRAPQRHSMRATPPRGHAVTAGLLPCATSRSPSARGHVHEVLAEFLCWSWAPNM